MVVVKRYPKSEIEQENEKCTKLIQIRRQVVHVPWCNRVFHLAYLCTYSYVYVPYISIYKWCTSEYLHIWRIVVIIRKMFPGQRSRPESRVRRGESESMVAIYECCVCTVLCDVREKLVYWFLTCEGPFFWQEGWNLKYFFPLQTFIIWHEKISLRISWNVAWKVESSTRNITVTNGNWYFWNYIL